MAEPERTQLLDRVRRFVATSPALAGRETFDLPYLTVVRRAARPVATAFGTPTRPDAVR